MKTSEKGAYLIKKHEGLILKAYLCPANVPTIGYGHTSTVTKDDVMNKKTITSAEADALLRKDILVSELAVKTNVKSALNQNQYDALVSFVFNLGEGNLRKSTLLKKVNANPSDPTIRDEFNKWVNGGGKRLPGLVKRRSEEADMYFS